MLTSHIYGLGKLVAFLRFGSIVKKKLDEVIKYFNGIYPTIKFTIKRSTNSIPFVDKKIQLHNDKIDTDLYLQTYK